MAFSNDNFLGHVVYGEGIHTDPDKVKQIQNWVTPGSVHHVRVFLGLTSYYRKYVMNYAQIACPLYELTKKDMEFFWSEEQQTAFQTLKK